MTTGLEQLERYLGEVLGVPVRSVDWAGSAALPALLRNRYSFFEAEVAGARCLLMVDRKAEEQPPAAVRKQVAQVRPKWDGEVVYVREEATPYNRKRLIEQGVSFVIPGNQMYLPTLGMDLREHFRRLRAEVVQFSPATQALMIHLLLRGAGEALKPSQAAGRLGYTPMTMTRAFDELASAGVGEVVREGRERLLKFGAAGRALWDKALPLMRSPVARRVCIKPPEGGPPGPRAGLTALGHYTRLAEPEVPVYAMSGPDWRAKRKAGQLQEIPIREPGTMEVEVWSYAPGLCAEGDAVDRLSLFLSLQEDKDERVQAALEELIGGLPW